MINQWPPSNWGGCWLSGLSDILPHSVTWMTFCPKVADVNWLPSHIARSHERHFTSYCLSSQPSASQPRPKVVCMTSAFAVPCCIPAMVDFNCLWWNDRTMTHWIYGISTEVMSDSLPEELGLGDLESLLCSCQLHWTNHIEYSEWPIKLVHSLRAADEENGPRYFGMVFFWRTEKNLA